MQFKPLVLATASFGMLIFSTGTPASAEDGISADTITFGQAAVLSGPAAALGQGMKAGMNAAFDEINKKGGLDQVFMTMIQADGKFKAVDRLIKLSSK